MSTAFITLIFLSRLLPARGPFTTVTLIFRFRLLLARVPFTRPTAVNLSSENRANFTAAGNVPSADWWE